MIRNNLAARHLVRWSVCAAIALAANSVVRAANDEVNANFTDGRSLRPTYMANEPASEGLLQTEMREHNMGGSWLSQNDIHLTGYVEGGWNFNFVRPPSGSNGTGRLFDDKSEDPKLNQLSLQLRRDVAMSHDLFDTGFDVQVIYGADARYTQANGTNFYGSSYAQQRHPTFLPFNNGNPSPVFDEVGFPGQEFPENQIDILQANMSFNFPVGNGLIVKAGKFVTPWGVESIDPTKNSLYSHSYIFSVSTPRTLTGVTASYQIDDRWSVMGGIVVGWNQSLADNNDFPSFLAQGTWKYSDEWTFVLTGIFGPEQEDNRSDYRSMLDLTAHWKAAEDITVSIESVFGLEPDTSVNRGKIFTNSPLLTFVGDDSTWFGLAGYVTYDWDPDGIWKFVLRGEYFSDGDGEFLIGTEVFSVSGGIIIHPFPHDEIGRNLMIRPELRYDYSNDQIFDGARQEWQCTLGADVIFSF